MTFVLIIFFVPAGVAMLSNWQWGPQLLNSFSEYFYWITETAGGPWSTVTSIIFFFIFCIALRIHSLGTMLRLGLILAAALFVGQAVKSKLKKTSEQPRPYVVWMENSANFDATDFYSLTKKERKRVIQKVADKTSAIPTWLARHWQTETNYSFPSGHTLFATTWAFLTVLLVGFRRHGLLITILIGWALLVEISRLLLGLHYPIDLIGSILISYVISLSVYFCIKPCHIVKLENS